MRDRMMGSLGMFRDPFGDDFFESRMRGFDDFNLDHFGNFENFEPTGNGNFVCQSYTSKTVIGPDGQPITEQKMKNKTQTYDSKGRKIVEDNEYYKNSKNNEKKYIKQKTLGDKTIKVKKE